MIYGEGLRTRDFTYVANLVHANLLAMRAESPLKGRPLNLGTGRRISLLDLVAAANATFEIDLQPEFRDPRPGDVRDSQAGLQRIWAAPGYEPLVDFEEGLGRTLALA